MKQSICKRTGSVSPASVFIRRNPALIEKYKRGMMLPATHMLAFSVWLVAQSKATASAPTVSIFLQPPGVIPLGGSTTICCRCLCHGGKMVLYKDGYQLRTLELHGNTAEFSISKATQMDRGLYSCHYVDGGNGTVLTCSDSMEVRVEESLLPGPSISVTPQEGAILGTSATVHCMCQCHQTVMLLYKSGNVSIQQRAWPVRGMATFIITQVAQEDGGAYACRYGNESDPSSLSQLSPFAELLVRDHKLVRPSLSLKPLGRVQLGTNVTLWCTSGVQRAQFYFWKNWEIVGVIEQESNVATFVLPHVMGHNGGTYTCSYRPWSQRYISSQPSNSVLLTVVDYTRSNIVRLALGVGVLILLGLMVAEAMNSQRNTPGQLPPLE
ncbi:immunoglobulin superfamily member 1 isoform X2 [Gallus gallus]|uniref:immunoglobulin superfamily member 1 isoform X2 n=1 Tax=Gallus gallus TaxID=9031 RepID=UPI001F02C1D4|nr:immunoglobulin superfamily member 1 isoform X2 [Gallus gallus]XP_046786570.1 immunoglobulin superfamily member 1 isoform X2 [Gallus gallus]